MRVAFFFLLVFVVKSTNAIDYYVSAAGNDTNDGISQTTAWKTIAKVNSFNGYFANDVINFRCGDVFYGSINVQTSLLTFQSYGSGAKPVISGFTNISSKGGWAISGNVYSKTVSTATANLFVVTVGGIPMEMGRFPNSTAANAGYLAYETLTSNSITDNDFTAGSVPADWSSADICIRKRDYLIERNKISSISGTTSTIFNYLTPVNSINPNFSPETLPGISGYGYFIQNALSTLDSHGEWYFNPTTKNFSIYLSSAPVNYTIQVCTVDRLLNIGTSEHTTVQGLSFTGANKSGIFCGDILNSLLNTVTITNCDFSNIGGRAIQVLRTGNVTIQNCTFNWCLSTGIQVYYPAASFAGTNCTISGCTLNNIAPYNGMGSFCDKGDYNAIHCNNNNSLIESNNIQNVGKAGIAWQGNDNTIRWNFLNNCVKFFNDFGGIYTYTDDGSPNYTNRLIDNNIVLNTTGQHLGTTGSIPRATGIYLDGKTMEVTVSNNSVAYSSRNGIHCNNPYHVTINANTLYNNLNAISFMRWTGTSNPGIDIPQLNINVTNNICYSTDATHRNIYYTNKGLNYPTTTNLATDLANLGTFNNNYYSQKNPVPFQLEIYNNPGGALIPTSLMSLEGWRTLSSKDGLSVKIPKIKSYIINTLSTTPANWFNNFGFDNNIAGITTSGATQVWDGNSQVTGVGSLKIDFPTNTPNSYSLHHSPLGTLSGSTYYVLSFTTRGTTSNGIVKASLRSTANINTILAPAQTHAYNNTLMDHEFLFFSSAGGPTNFAIELERNSGTTYIDNVRFVEAIDIDLIANINNELFKYNNTFSPVNTLLGDTYKDAPGVTYNGSITLQPFTSSILFKSALQTMRPMSQPPTNPLVVNNIGLQINCYPNPTKSTLTIDHMNAKDEWEFVEILSIEGRQTGILSKFAGNTRLSIDLSGLANGKYFALITNKKGKSKVLSFVKL